MNDLLIVGAGGHGKVVADAALASGWSQIAFLDDRMDALGSPLGLPVLGPVSELESYVGRGRAAVIAIGDAHRRVQLLQRCRAGGFEIVSIIHPAAQVSRFATLAAGCVVFAQAAINADARLGEGCIVNTGATVDHDCELGCGVHICPGTHLAGNVRVGDFTWVGIGAVVRQDIVIGRDATIGAGAVVVKDVTDGAVAAGVPARERTSSR